jgi:hypothetical protein
MIKVCNIRHYSTPILRYNSKNIKINFINNKTLVAKKESYKHMYNCLPIKSLETDLNKLRHQQDSNLRGHSPMD